jgi:hypothetical protein
VDNAQERFLQAVNVSKGRVLIAQKVAWAGSSVERRRGLLGRSSLSTEEGIYLAPCEWLHTFGMRFPIDVAFLSAEGRVLALHHGLKPNRISKIVLRAAGVLELSEGTLHVTNTEIGDTVQLLNITARE